MKKILLLLISIFILSGCNDSDSTLENDLPSEKTENQNNDIKETENLSYKSDFNHSLTKNEKMLLEPNGIYSGTDYNENALNEDLSQLPKDLTVAEYYEQILSFLKEDYYNELESLINFDDSINTISEKPNEDIDYSINNLHYVLLLDASGSMAGELEGMPKMEIAKNSIRKFVSNLPTEAKISLKVYGHKGSNKEEDKSLSCSSTETIYSGDFNDAAFQESLSAIQPKGWTPLALALESVKKEMNENEKIITYVVSDGIETCDGDPIQIVKNFKDTEQDITVNVIGFDINNNEQKALKQISDAGSGDFINVNSIYQLDEYLRKQYEIQQMEWDNWKEGGIDTVLAISDTKKSDVKSIEKAINDIAHKEYENLNKALSYLQKSLDISIEQSNEISNKISNRYYQILGYTKESSDLLRYNIGENASKEIDIYNSQGNEKIQENLLKRSDLKN